MTDPIQSENDLRYWLVTEDRYLSAHTREWLERTAPDQAAHMLARIAQHAQPETRPAWRVMLADFAGVLLFTSDAVSHQGPNARKAGTRAALMLADRHDARCLAPLARAFETRPSQQSKYQKRIEDALTRVLSQEANPARRAARPETEQQEARNAVQTLAQRLWGHGGAPGPFRRVRRPADRRAALPPRLGRRAEPGSAAIYRHITFGNAGAGASQRNRHNASCDSGKTRQRGVKTRCRTQTRRKTGTASPKRRTM